jgi:hypothetical protein
MQQHHPQQPPPQAGDMPFPPQGQLGGQTFASTLLLSFSCAPLLKAHLMRTLHMNNEELASLEPVLAEAWERWDHAVSNCLLLSVLVLVQLTFPSSAVLTMLRQSKREYLSLLREQAPIPLKSLRIHHRLVHMQCHRAPPTALIPSTRQATSFGRVSTGHSQPLRLSVHLLLRLLRPRKPSNNSNNSSSRRRRPPIASHRIRSIRI